MNHITQEQAVELGENFADVFIDTKGGVEFSFDNYGVHELCNAAIEWHIAQQAAKEPIAYFDFQGKGFRWANNVAIGEVPVIVKVAPMPLYSDLYKKDQKMNTSQERVRETAKNEQMPLSDPQIYAALGSDIDDIANAKHDPESWQVIVSMVRAIEKAHGIKEPKV